MKMKSLSMAPTLLVVALAKNFPTCHKVCQTYILCGIYGKRGLRWYIFPMQWVKMNSTSKITCSLGLMSKVFIKLQSRWGLQICVKVKMGLH